MYVCVWCHNVQNSTCQKPHTNNQPAQSVSPFRAPSPVRPFAPLSVSQWGVEQCRLATRRDDGDAGVRVALPPKTKSKLSTQFSIKLTKCTRTHHSATHTRRHTRAHTRTHAHTHTHSGTKLRSNVLIQASPTPSLSCRHRKARKK